MNETFVAHEDGAFRCYMTRTGRDRHYLGCAHEKPREAIAHTVPVYVSPLRPLGEPSVIPPTGSTPRGGARLTEATTASTRTRRLLPPVGSGALT